MTRAAPTPLPPALRRATLPPAVRAVLEALDARGHRSWVVGGAVRDLLLGRTRAGTDVDVATPAKPDEVMAAFRKVIPTGVDHGTVTVLEHGVPVEVTTFRGEGEYRDGRRPSSVTFLSDIDGDLARRDFTMNAIAWDPIAGELRDPFGGRADLERGLIRAVGDPVQRFAEDGLRPLRAVRFAAQLGFTLHAPTERAIPGALGVTAKVSAERVCEELSRLLVAPNVEPALALLERTGILSLVLPGVATLDRTLRRHAFRATAAIDGAELLELRLAALLHPLAAVEPRAVVAAGLRDLLARLRFSNYTAERVAALIRAHGCLLEPERPADPATAPELRRWVAERGEPLVPGVLSLWQADAGALPAAKARAAEARLDTFRARVAEALRARPPLTAAELALDGQGVMTVLGIAPGRAVGEALRHLLDRVIEDPDLNTRPALEDAVRAWWRGRSEGGSR